MVARLRGEALAVPAHRHEGVRQLLERMLHLHHEERPSAAEALAHPFFHQAVTEEDVGVEARLWGVTRACAVEAKCLERVLIVAIVLTHAVKRYHQQIGCRAQCWLAQRGRGQLGSRYISTTQRSPCYSAADFTL